MGCIEIHILLAHISFLTLFNRNMGCIEIGFADCDKSEGLGLIETWDVLKSHLMVFYRLACFPFNRNMGCIEIRILD